MKVGRKIAIAICIVIFCISLYNLLIIWRDYAANDNLYDQAEASFLAPYEEQGSGASNVAAKTTITIPQFDVDIETLADNNPDIRGWIWLYDTSINYPLVQGENNNFYIKRAYDGTSSSAGSIFVDYRNRSDFSDRNTILYGHNMRNGSMFGQLKKFKSQDFLKNRESFYIFQGGRWHEYGIFSAYTTDAYSDTYTLKFENDETFSQWLEKITSQTAITTEIQVTETDKVVTLSTCSGTGNTRFVVHGKLIS